MSQTKRIGEYSPWGLIDASDTLAPGIAFVSTPSHGGIFLDYDHEQSIPVEVRKIARQYAPVGWYEEDCDLAIPVLWFAEELVEHGNADLVQGCVHYRGQERYRLLDKFLTRRDSARKFLDSHGIPD